MSTIRSLSVSFVSFMVIVCLAGCGSGSAVSSADYPAAGGSGSESPTGNSPAENPGGSAAPTGVAKLSWDAPTNADGTPLAGVAGFKVYYGTSSKSYSSYVYVGMATTYSIEGLLPGTYFFTVTTIDSSGNESSFSNEASKAIP